MTNPFAVQPGGVISMPGAGDALASSLAGVLSAMKQREELDRQRQEFDSKQAYFKTLNEGNELENEQKRRKLKDEDRLLQARGAGLDAFSQWVGAGANFNDLGKIVARIKDPDTAQDFIGRVTNHFQAQQQAGQAQQATVNAEVATATKEDEKKKAKANAETAANQAVTTGAEAGQAAAQQAAQTALLQARAQEAQQSLQQPAAGVTPQQVNAFTNLYRSGAMTAGQAAQTTGVPLPAGMDPNQKFEVQTRGMAIRKAEQKTAAAQSLLANGEMEGLIGEGVTITKFTPLKDAVPFDLGRGMIPEKEQQMLAASGQFVSQYVLSVSGKAATDKEREFIMKQIVPRAGDRGATLEQKRIMREAMVQIMFDGAQGATRPLSEIIESTIGAAKAKGASGYALQFLRESQKRAKQMELQAKATGPDDLVPFTVDATAPTPDSVQAYFDSLGR